MSKFVTRKPRNEYTRTVELKRVKLKDPDKYLFDQSTGIVWRVGKDLDLKRIKTEKPELYKEYSFMRKGIPKFNVVKFRKEHPKLTEKYSNDMSIHDTPITPFVKEHLEKELEVVKTVGKRNFVFKTRQGLTDSVVTVGEEVGKEKTAGKLTKQRV